MEVIIMLILFSLIIATGFLAAFIWATKSGQYDDTYSPGVRMLFDDKPKQKKERATENLSKESNTENG
jgi:cbb3-type cytochrome oxidase maturation protein